MIETKPVVEFLQFQIEGERAIGEEFQKIDIKIEKSEKIAEEQEEKFTKFNEKAGELSKKVAQAFEGIAAKIKALEQKLSENA